MNLFRGSYFLLAFRVTPGAIVGENYYTEILRIHGNPMTRVASDDKSSIRWAQKVRKYELEKSKNIKNTQVLRMKYSIAGFLS